MYGTRKSIGTIYKFVNVLSIYGTECEGHEYDSDRHICSTVRHSVRIYNGTIRIMCKEHSQEYIMCNGDRRCCTFLGRRRQQFWRMMASMMEVVVVVVVVVVNQYDTPP
jgi:hypothetical protein